MDKIVVIDGEVSLRNVIDGGEPYPVLRVSEGIRDYERLINLPQIEDVTLIGNKTFEELGLSEISGEELVIILGD